MIKTARLSANSRNQSNRGFTVIEVLVAASIFSIAIVGVAISTKSVIQTNQKNYFTSVATSLAQDKLEELKATPSTIASGGPISDVIDGQTFTRTWTVTSNSPISGVKKIDVTVTWTNYGNQTITISSAIQG
jgi:type IV pilus assembly protein PilV